MKRSEYITPETTEEVTIMPQGIIAASGSGANIEDYENMGDLFQN